MQILDEVGRGVFGPTIDNRITETNNRCIRRPLTDIGRRLLGAYSLVIQEDFEATIHISLNAGIDVETVPCEPCWDLKQMMPAKFRQAPMMVGYLDALSYVVNSIACRIGRISSLADIDACPRRYLGHLAALIAYKLKNQKYSTIKELRNQIKMAIEMYKIKGTYEVLKLAFYVIGLDIQIWDLWTRDYVVFERQPPHKHSGIPPEFGGWETEEVLHCDDGYFMDEVDSSGEPAPWHFDGGLAFKSPHFDLVLKLNKLITYEDYLNNLFIMDYWDYLDEILEEYTPINTVPHLYLELYGLCYEDYLAYTIPDSQVKTCIMNVWDLTALYFDDGNLLDQHLEPPFPDQKFLDQSFEALVSTITILKLGDGNVENTPSPTDTDLEHVIYTGTVNRFEIIQDRVSFYATVPAGVELNNVTELGLYQDVLPNPILAVESFFPPFDKPSAATLEIRIDVMRRLGA